MDFTDLGLTIFGGAGVLARTARRFGLFVLLVEAVSIEVRDRGASDAETMREMITAQAHGHGALSGLDALGADAAALLGLSRVPEARRAGKDYNIGSLRRVARRQLEVDEMSSRFPPESDVLWRHQLP